MGEQRDIAGLRAAIADLDRALFELIARRMELAAELGRARAGSADPHERWDAGDRSLVRAREQAATAGTTPDVMQDIFRAIQRGSIQRQQGARTSDSTHSERVLILGAAGGMGSWFGRFFEAAGKRVDRVDPILAELPAQPGAFAELEEVSDVDLYDTILIAVPLERAPRVLELVLAKGPRGLVVEVASIKSPQVEMLERAGRAGTAVCALHPMFGPQKSPFEPLTFVLACVDDTALERQRAESLLRHPYSQLVSIPLRHHDRLMGWLLGLAHLTGMLFASALSRSGLDPEELRACASTTFLRQAQTATSILDEDPDLYLSIQRLNPHREEVYRATRQALEALVGAVEAGDSESFHSLLDTARQAVSPTLGAQGSSAETQRSPA